jgi:hypothetical protein
VKKTSWSYAPANPCKIVQSWGCTFGGFSERANAAVERLETPAAATVIILCCGEPITLRPAFAPGSSARLTAFSAGFQVPAQRVKHSGLNDCVELRLPPLAAYILFGGALSESNRDPLNLFDIAHRPITILLDRLRATSEWHLRLNAVDQFLAHGFAASKRRPPPELTWAWKSLERSHGQVRIRELARRLQS